MHNMKYSDVQEAIWKHLLLHLCGLRMWIWVTDSSQYRQHDTSCCCNVSRLWCRWETSAQHLVHFHWFDDKSPPCAKEKFCETKWLLAITGSYTAQQDDDSHELKNRLGPQHTMWSVAAKLNTTLILVHCSYIPWPHFQPDNMELFIAMVMNKWISAELWLNYGEMGKMKHSFNTCPSATLCTTNPTQWSGIQLVPLQWEGGNELTEQSRSLTIRKRVSCNMCSIYLWCIATAGHNEHEIKTTQTKISQP